jgi:hypothetical protein
MEHTVAKRKTPSLPVPTPPEFTIFPEPSGGIRVEAKDLDHLINRMGTALNQIMSKDQPPTPREGPDGFGRFRFRGWSFDLTPSEQAVMQALCQAGVGTPVPVNDIGTALDKIRGRNSPPDARKKAASTPAEQMKRTEERVDRHKKALVRKLTKGSDGAVSIRQKRDGGGVLHYSLVVEE